MPHSPPCHQLLDMLQFYTKFQINDQTGDALTDDEMDEIHYKKVNHLQVGLYLGVNCKPKRKCGKTLAAK